MQTSQAFRDIRVLDLTSSLAGAIASMHLGDFGAEVVRCESSLNRKSALGSGYIYANRNKTLTQLDSETAPGLSEIRRLLRGADAVVIDGPRARLEDFGLDATTTRSSNSRLIHLWMPSFGTRGRGSSFPADDLLLGASTGVSDQQPAAHDVPVALVVPILSYEQGALGATAIAAALLRRETTGHGSEVNVSGLHAVAAMNGSLWTDLPGIVRPFGGSKGGLGIGPNYRMYQCRDGKWIFLAALTQSFFIMALDALEMLDVMAGPGVDGDIMNLRLPEVQVTVSARMEARIKEQDRAHWQRIFNGAGVPNGPIDPRDVWLTSESVAAIDALVRVDHSELGSVVLPNVAAHLSSTPGHVGRLPDPRAVVDASGLWRDVPDAPPSNQPLPQDTERPLAGIRVLDLGSFLAGPFASEVLVDFGADVVKVEHPNGDGYRVTTATYAATNRDKRNVCLDLKNERDLAAFFTLVRSADVVVDNVRFGVPERLGIDFDALKRVNPTVVRCTITGWGAGPLRDTPCFDPLIQARGGMMVAQGGGDEPVFSAMPVHDVGSGTIAAFGVLTALFARQRLGVGQEVKVSLAATTMTLQAGEMTSFAGSAAPLTGGRDFVGPSPLRRLYRCRDGWIALNAEGGELEGKTLAEALRSGREPAPPGESSGEFERLFATLSVEAALDRLAAGDIPAVRVLGRTEIFRDSWLVDNDFLLVVDDSDVGPVRAVGGFAAWTSVHGADRPEERHFSRALGEDTIEVLRAAGVPAADLAERSR